MLADKEVSLRGRVKKKKKKQQTKKNKKHTRNASKNKDLKLLCWDGFRGKVLKNQMGGGG